MHITFHSFLYFIMWYLYTVEVFKMNQLFINNEFIASESTETMDVVNPATGQVFDTITFANENDVNIVVAKSQ